MRKEERIAVIRVFYDLIMADTVIDSGEMQYFAILQNEFKFSKQEQMLAKSLTLAEALAVLSESDTALRQSIIDHCNQLSVSDGFCARSEALLIIAIIKTLAAQKHENAQVISVPKHLFNIPDSCVLYIESEHDTAIEKQIDSRYRYLFSDFRLAGMEFIYVPHVIRHYIESPDSLVRQIVSFVAPGLSETGLDACIEKLRSMTTVEFTKDILCNKLGMTMMRDTPPSFLIKIGTSFVDDAVYSNYLKIDISGNIEAYVSKFVDEYTSMLSSDLIVVSNNKEQTNQFFYTGFYKLLIDAHLMRKNVRSRIFIDPYREEIYFPDIDTALQGLHRREKALYLMFAFLSIDGGVSFSQPLSARQMEAYEKRMKKVQKLYAAAYSRFGGDADKAPDISLPESRRPMLSLIKRCINKNSANLYNIDDYHITKDSSGYYSINLESDLIFIKDLTTSQYKPLKECKLNIPD